MNHFKPWLALFSGVVFSLIFTLAQASTLGSPVGYWKVIDDVTGKPKSIVQIWQTQNQLLMGKVVKIFPKNNKIAIPVCSRCSGHQRNQPVVGLLVLNGLKATSRQWGGGKILDPENGRTYNCALRVSENGEKLNVKGYIGLPLFGRSQTWERVDLMSG